MAVDQAGPAAAGGPGPGSVGWLLRELRRAALLTQEDLADRSGVSVGTIAGLEAGRTLRPRGSSLRLLADALGLSGEQRARLSQAAQATGTGSGPGRAAVAGVPVPAQLPAGVAGFTGRGGYLDQLDGLLADAAERTDASVVISAIGGTAGVGKTALAVHWAHQVADRFPDGQLYVNLRGYSRGAQPLRPVEALAGLVRALGVAPEQIPTELAEAAALYRTRLAGRRVLIVLDNAGSSEQVRALLPGTPGCLVVVTSRDRLGSLVARDGARPVALGVLPAAESHALLVRLLGKRRVDAEPEAAAGLAVACAHLPLALRIAAANIVGPPARGIAGYLAESTPGPSHPSGGGVVSEEVAAVHAALDVSYLHIPVAAARLLRLLGLVPGPDVTPGAAAALAGTSLVEARRLLRQLAAAHLVEEHVADRFSFHDLIRGYARDLAHRHDPPADRQGAIDRLLHWYLHTTDAACGVLAPVTSPLPLPATDLVDPPAGLSFPDFASAMAWCESELPNLVAVVRHAAGAGPLPFAWLLLDRLAPYLWESRHTADWATISAVAMSAAHRSGDQLAAAVVCRNLGDLDTVRARFPEAAAHLRAARSLARRSGWTDALPGIVGKLGQCYWLAGRLEDAAVHLRESLTMAREAGRLGVIAPALNALGGVYQELGRLGEAAECFADSMTWHERDENHAGLALVLNNVGTTYHELGRFPESIAHLHRATALARELGIDHIEMLAANNLAGVHLDTGRLAEALESATTALERAEQLADRHSEAYARCTIGSVQLRLGQADEALDQYHTALAATDEIETREAVIEALLGRAEVYQHLGRLDDAYADAHRALTITRDSQYRVREGHALTVLAEIQLARGHPTQAHQTAGQALANQQQTGHRPGQARTLAVLSRIAAATGDPDTATGHARAARTLFTELGTPVPGDIDTTAAAP